MAIRFKTSPRDLAISAAALAVFGGYCGYVWWDIQSKHLELEARAQEIVNDFYKDEKKENFEWLTEVKSGKVNYLFGSDWGVIRFYSRHKGDVKMETFIGLERFHNYGVSGWQETDFAKIDQPAHIYEGYSYFEANGYGVSEDAYKRYN